MHKLVFPLLITSLLLAGCAGNKTPECNCSNTSTVISSSNTSMITSQTTSSKPADKEPLSIGVSETNQKIPYGTNIDEIKYEVILTYRDGSKRILSKNEYTLSFAKNATFSVGSGQAVLTYNEDTSIKSDVNFEIVPRKYASLLFIGNSFSDDTIEYMYNIASSLGIGLSVNNLFIGSSTLDVHYNNLRNDSPAYEYRSWNGTSWVTTLNYKISTALKQEVWDFVSLQQGSGSSGLYSTYSHLNDCLSLIKKDLLDVNHTQFIWNMTWAYQQNSTHGEFVNYGYDQICMYESIVNCVKQLDRDIFKVIIPSGTAIQNARTSTLGDTLTRDGFHLSVGAGRYIAALNAIRAITGVSFDEVPYAPAIDASTKEICLESVENAWKKPYEITQSTYKPESEDYSELIKKMTKLNLTFTRDYYYYSISPDAKTTPIGGDRPDLICTKIFNKSEIPNGSIIHIAPGFRYRPEGWIALNTYWTGERPENVTTEYVKVDDAWWGSFTLRAFNISNTMGSSLAGNYEQAEAAFSIYVPNL